MKISNHKDEAAGFLFEISPVIAKKGGQDLPHAMRAMVKEVSIGMTRYSGTSQK